MLTLGSGTLTTGGRLLIAAPHEWEVHQAPHDYFLVEGARSWTVSDQLMKKELILQSMGWGHMPRFLVADELRSGKLLAIIGRHFKGGSAEIVAARRRDAPQGPIAARLWQYIADQAPILKAAVRSDEDVPSYTRA